MKPGDRVLLTVGKRTVEAEVALVLPDGRPVGLTFDALLELTPDENAAGSLVLLARPDGSYRCAFTPVEVQIEEIPS